MVNGLFQARVCQNCKQPSSFNCGLWMQVMSRALSDYGVQKVNMYRRMSTGYGRLGCFHSWKWVSFSCQQHNSSIGCSVRRHWFGTLTEDFCRGPFPIWKLIPGWCSEGCWLEWWLRSFLGTEILRYSIWWHCVWGVGESLTRIHCRPRIGCLWRWERGPCCCNDLGHWQQDWWGHRAHQAGSALQNASRWAFCFWAFCFVLAQLLTPGPS